MEGVKFRGPVGFSEAWNAAQILMLLFKTRWI